MDESLTGPQRIRGGLVPAWSYAHKTGTGQTGAARGAENANERKSICFHWRRTAIIRSHAIGSDHLDAFVSACGDPANQTAAAIQANFAGARQCLGA